MTNLLPYFGWHRECRVSVDLNIVELTSKVVVYGVPTCTLSPVFQFSFDPQPDGTNAGLDRFVRPVSAGLVSPTAMVVRGWRPSWLANDARRLWYSLTLHTSRPCSLQHTSDKTSYLSFLSLHLVPSHHGKVQCIALWHSHLCESLMMFPVLILYAVSPDVRSVDPLMSLSLGIRIGIDI